MRHPLAIAVALLVPCVAAAAPRLEAPFAHTAGPEVPVRGALAIDLDGDGRLDLVGDRRRRSEETPLAATRFITIRHGRQTGPSGEFLEWPVDLPAGGGGNSLAAGDLDGDGRPEILLLAEMLAAPDELQVIRIDEQWRCEPGWRLATSACRGLARVRPEPGGRGGVVLLSEAGELRYLAATGDPAAPLADDSGLQSAAGADVLLGGGGGMMIVRQRAGLEFDPPLIWDTGTAGDHVACDLDGDALPDLVAASPALSFVRNLSGGGGTSVLLSGVRIRDVGGGLLFRDDLAGVAPAPTVAYRLEAVGEDGGLGWYGPYRHAWPASLLAAGLELSCPSPLRGAGRILYASGRPGPARLRVYDLRGRLVRELFRGPLAAGRHEALWDGADARGTPVASGVYLLRLEQGPRCRLRKTILLR